jgi:hypothetical protein
VSLSDKDFAGCVECAVHSKEAFHFIGLPLLNPSLRDMHTMIIIINRCALFDGEKVRVFALHCIGLLLCVACRAVLAESLLKYFSERN